MISFLSIKITDTGRHWCKEIRLCGLLIYSRHDFSKEEKKTPIGFATYPYLPIEIEEEEYMPED